MIISILSGAYKNAGDYLIESRSLALLKHVYPNATIRKVLRSEISEKVGELNESDILVFAGGPIYMKALENYLDIDTFLNQINKPAAVLGGGWYGFEDGNDFTYHYRFSEKTKAFFQRIDREGKGLSCRDLYSCKTLLKEKLENVVMTGCPAWYDIDRIHQTHLTHPSGDIRKIVISDPDRPVNYAGCLNLLDYLKRKYPAAEIMFVFHRGREADKYTPKDGAAMIQDFASKIEKKGIRICDISYGHEGFQIYDECDMHIGYRVHAHIYNLSRRNRTVLIEEDGRGAGVNQALGLPSIKAYNDSFQVNNPLLQKVYRKTSLYTYKHLISDVDVYLELLKATNNQYLLNAFKLQEKYFDNMVKFIERLGGNN